MMYKCVCDPDETVEDWLKKKRVEINLDWVALPIEYPVSVNINIMLEMQYTDCLLRLCSAILLMRMRMNNNVWLYA